MNYSGDAVEQVVRISLEGTGFTYYEGLNVLFHLSVFKENGE